MPIPSRAPFHESRLDWLRRVHPQACPECKPATHIPKTQLKMTAWCPTCERVWKAECYWGERGLKLIWYHEQDHATARELPLKT